MSAVNPYAAPQAQSYAPAIVQSRPLDGLWREGGVLVMHKNAPLPDICIKSNEPAVRRLKRKLQWHHPAIGLTILIGVLIYVILAMILTKRATIHIAMTDEWFARRSRRMLIAWGLALAAVLMFVGSFFTIEVADGVVFAFLIFASVVLLIAAPIYGQAACRMVWPKRMTDDYIWLKGVHPGFLDRLEAFPYKV
jgi:hypothetical protein